MLSGRVLITGGSGFLGRGIMKRAKDDEWDTEFTVYSRDELKQHQCRLKYPDANYVLGDINDADRLTLAMQNHDVVIHAAALKYVPEAEKNVLECIRVNVMGTRAVCAAAAEARSVSTVVLISTDKAVEPVNTYGLSKALAERIFYEYSRLIVEKRYVACRYGNVIGSTGSVVPVFKEQADRLGFINLTDPSMTRFWISVDEAVDLIVACVNNAETGEIVVPLPKAMTLEDLAIAVCPGIETKILGPRPGEKKHEKLLTTHEACKSSGKDWLIYYHPDRKITEAAASTTKMMELTSDKASPMLPVTFAEIAATAALV